MVAIVLAAGKNEVIVIIIVIVSLVRLFSFLAFVSFAVLIPFVFHLAAMMLHPSW